MLNRVQMRTAFRTRAATLAAVTTGSVSLSATAVGFVRTTGSFVTDGFVAGMEITPSGFALNTTRKVITAVSALLLTIDSGINSGTVVESAAGSRSLVAGLPEDRAWELTELVPRVGKPYVEEDLALGGPGTQPGQSNAGLIEHVGLWMLRCYGPDKVGTDALDRVGDALCTLFRPGTSFTLTNGDRVDVRCDLTPWPGRVQPVKPGWALSVVTIPFRYYAINS